jgi:hypothetical protein
VIVSFTCVYQAELDKWFGQNAVFYLKSPDRETIESGVMGFRVTPEGISIIASTLHRYVSQEFRDDCRWDDGYQFQLALQLHVNVPSVDLATHASGRKPFGHVVENSPVGKYLAHRKGVHKGWSLRLAR